MLRFFADLLSEYHLGSLFPLGVVTNSPLPTISVGINGDRFFSHRQVDFWNSYQDAELKAIGCKCYRFGDMSFRRKCSKHPTQEVRAADVLYCGVMDDPGTFEDFCTNFGYDTDSRQAESMWRASCTQYQLFVSMFTPAELDSLREAVQEL